MNDDHDSPEELFNKKDFPKLTALIYTGLAFFSLFLIHNRHDSFPPEYLYGNQNAFLQLGAGIGVGLIIVAFSALSSYYSQRAREVENFFRRLLGPLRLRDIFLIAFFSSIGEELFFRGALQPSIGLVWTSLLFGLAHYAPDNTTLSFYPFLATALGFLFGFMMIHFGGGLLAPIAAHFTINLGNLYRMNYYPGESFSKEESSVDQEEQKD